MKSRAAVAFAPGKPLEIVEIDVAPPKKGEVLVRSATPASATPMRLPCPVTIRKACSPACSATRARAWWSRWARASPRYSRATT